MEKVINEEAMKLAKINKMPVLAIINADRNERIDEVFRSEHIMMIRNLLSKCNSERLGLLIHTFGGEVNISAQIAYMLQSLSKKLKGFVPKSAYSGGTLIALACDQIVMNDCANLGPLDAQYKIYSKEKFNSSLAVFTGLDELRKFTIGTLKEVLPDIRTITDDRLVIQDELKAASDFATGLTSALVNSLSTEYIGSRQRKLRLVGDHMERILANNPEFQNEENQGPDMDRIRRVINTLVYSFNDHGFIITRDEAVAIGLPIYCQSKKEQKILDIISHSILHLNSNIVRLVDPARKKIIRFRDIDPSESE